MSENEKIKTIKKIIIDNKVKNIYDLMRWTRQDKEIENYFFYNRDIINRLIIEYIETGNIE